jgi:N-acyl-D-amino-acid deacylase
VRGAVDVVRGAVLPLPDGRLSGPVDLHLAEGRVRDVVPASARTPAGRVLEAGGRIALPGLVDAHVHAGGAVFDPEVQLALLRQGVTSIVTGADGVGYAPSDRASLLWASGYFAGIDGDHPRFAGGTVAELLATYERTTPVNVGVLVPHGTVRHLVLGTAQRRASRAEAEKMASVVAQAFADGALGLSTGLEYVPAAWADHAELVALARVAAEHGLPHVSHMRGYEARAARAFAELLRLSADTGVATHVSHLHGPADTLVAMLDDALAQGHDVTFDSYPYLRGCSILAMVALPTWLPLADPDATLSAIDAPALRLRLRAHLAGLDDLWPRVTLAWVPGLGAEEQVAGRPLVEVAARWGVSPGDAALRVLRASRLRASCVFAQPPTNSAESVRRLAGHRAHLGGSDAIYQPVGADAGQGRPHPRGWGAFARFLAQQVLGSGDWSWHDAVEHLSARPARRFRLAGRGSLAPGAVADVVLVDPATLVDRATYDDPRRPATGVDDVVVAGVPVLVDGEATRARPGRALRPGAPDPAPRAGG